jgi:hypothetical protein
MEYPERDLDPFNTVMIQFNWYQYLI